MNHRLDSHKGFTLVEVLTAGTLLALSIVAITSMLRATTELSIKPDLERQAYTILNSTTDSLFRRLTTPGYNAIPASGTILYALTGESNSVVPCTLYISSLESNREINGISVPFKRVNLKMSWNQGFIDDTVYCVKLDYE